MAAMICVSFRRMEKYQLLPVLARNVGYDAKNASGLKNGQPFPSIGSLEKLKYTEDGSVDLYFGPQLPAGAPESNYLRTVPGKGWFTLLRLYSPTQAFFDKSWRPDDFEKINQ